eukprot:3917188-Prorocentrum_lima.AAC.1
MGLVCFRFSGVLWFPGCENQDGEDRQDRGCEVSPALANPKHQQQPEERYSPRRRTTAFPRRPCSIPSRRLGPPR